MALKKIPTQIKRSWTFRRRLLICSCGTHVYYSRYTERRILPSQVIEGYNLTKRRWSLRINALGWVGGHRNFHIKLEDGQLMSSQTRAFVSAYGQLTGQNYICVNWRHSESWLVGSNRKIVILGTRKVGQNSLS